MAAVAVAGASLLSLGGATPPPLHSLPLLSTSSTSTLLTTSNAFTRLHKKSVGLVSNPLALICVATHCIHKERRAMVSKAMADVDGTDQDGSGPPSESDEDNLLVENLPLESKLQLKLEQKMRMKLAKKIRLRRKKLVRKRRMRKKGRWPPSKLKKNKNV